MLTQQRAPCLAMAGLRPAQASIQAGAAAPKTALVGKALVKVRSPPSRPRRRSAGELPHLIA